MPKRSGIYFVALVAGIPVAAGCSNARTELGRSGGQPPASDAAAKMSDARAPDGATSKTDSGPRPGLTCAALDAVFTDAAPAPMRVVPQAQPLCRTSECPADGGCPRFEWPVVQDCVVGLDQTITVGCGVVSVEGSVSDNLRVQDLYDDRTGARLGSRQEVSMFNAFDPALYPCTVTPAGEGLFGDSLVRWKTLCPSSITCATCSPPGQAKTGYTCTCPDGEQTQWMVGKGR